MSEVLVHGIMVEHAIKTVQKVAVVAKVHSIVIFEGLYLADM